MYRMPRALYMQRVFVRNTRSVQGDYLRQLVLEIFNLESAKCKLSIFSPVIPCGTVNTTYTYCSVTRLQQFHTQHKCKERTKARDVGV